VEYDNPSKEETHQEGLIYIAGSTGQAIWETYKLLQDHTYNWRKSTKHHTGTDELHKNRWQNKSFRSPKLSNFICNRKPDLQLHSPMSALHTHGNKPLGISCHLNGVYNNWKWSFAVPSFTATKGSAPFKCSLREPHKKTAQVNSRILTLQVIWTFAECVTRKTTFDATQSTKHDSKA
jgi:hypothetical protein